MTKRPNLLVILGAALFLVGGAIVFLVLRNDDTGRSPSAGRQLVPVVVATTNLSAGESGDAVLASGAIVVRQVPLSQRSAEAISSSTMLSGQTLDAVASGSQVPLTALSPPNLRSSSIQIPKGEQAVAVTVNYTAGLAGYAAAGDRVNVYTVVAPNAPNTTPATAPASAATADRPSTPFAKLLLSNVQVLDVSDEVAPRVTTASDGTADPDVSGEQRAGGSTLTLLLALNAQQAEQAIFATSVNQLYFTVLPKGQGASTTKGVGYGLNYPVPSPDGAGK